MTDHRLLHPITHSTPSSTQPSVVPGTPAARPTARPALEEVSFSSPSGIVVPDPSRAIVREPSRRAPDVVPGGYPLWELPAPLRRLCESLEAATEDGAIPLEVMRDQLDRLEDNLQMLAPWWMFDACTYRRNLIRRTAAYEALLLCWLPGQRSPIHDHRGSGCAFRVVEGVVTRDALRARRARTTSSAPPRCAGSRRAPSARAASWTSTRSPTRSRRRTWSRSTSTRRRCAT